MIGVIEKIGDSFLYYLEMTGQMVLLLVRSIVALFKRPFDWFGIVRQVHFIGAKSLLVIVVAGLFTGMVLALQFYNTLERFGSIVAR